MGGGGATGCKVVVEVREKVDVEGFVGEAEREEGMLGWGGGVRWWVGGAREQGGSGRGGAGWCASRNGPGLGGGWHCHGWMGPDPMNVGRFGGSRGDAGNNPNFAPEINCDVDTGGFQLSGRLVMG